MPEYGQDFQPRISRNSKKYKKNIIVDTSIVNTKGVHEFHPNTEESTDSKKSHEININMDC